MAVSLSEYELEALPELAVGGQGEFEAEYESEEFFRQLGQLARRAVSSPALRGIARRAARAARTAMFAGRIFSTAVQPLPDVAVPPVQPTPIEAPWGRRGSQMGAAGQYPPEGGPAGDTEWEFEEEVAAAPAAAAAAMEHLGHAAAEAEREAEAEAFIGALIPLAARLLPRVGGAIMRSAPRLIQGAARVARTLRQNPATRPLVRAVPTIVRQTAAQMARQVSQGRPVTAQNAVQTLARQTYRVLSRPDRCVHAYRRSRALDHRYHAAAPGS